MNRVRLGKNSIRPALQSCFSEKPQHFNVALIYVTSATVGLVLLVAITAIQVKDRDKEGFQYLATKLLLYICPLLPKSIQDLQRITELQSFVYISVSFWKQRAIRFSNWMFTIEFEGITMNGTALTDDETRR